MSIGASSGRPGTHSQTESLALSHTESMHVAHTHYDKPGLGTR